MYSKYKDLRNSNDLKRNIDTFFITFWLSDVMRYMITRFKDDNIIKYKNIENETDRFVVVNYVKHVLNSY